MVEPGKYPKGTKLKDDLDSLQKDVIIGADYQGLIEIVSLGNGVCIMCFCGTVCLQLVFRRLFLALGNVCPKL